MSQHPYRIYLPLLVATLLAQVTVADDLVKNGDFNTNADGWTNQPQGGVIVKCR